MLNQFICILTRNVGAIATGCLIDGLINMFGVSPQAKGLLQRQDQATFSPDRGLTASEIPLGWLKHCYRLRYWHGQLIHLHLQPRLQLQ